MGEPADWPDWPRTVPRIEALHTRYVVEVVEDLSLCPFARRCREQGRLHRPTFLAAAAPEADAVARDLAALADLPGLARLIPSHGDILEPAPADALRRAIARDLEQPPR